MKKRFFSVFSLFFICLALVGCGKPSPDNVAVDTFCNIRKIALNHILQILQNVSFSNNVY